MCNWIRCSGANTGVHLVPLFLILSVAALAQQPPPQDPLDAAIQAVWQASGEGRFQDAAGSREQARTLLQRKPADAPQFANWALQVASLYQNSGSNAQARAILQDALTRTGPLGESYPSHIAMLSALGESWRQDGNLLKAVGYLEQAAAAQAVAATVTAPQPAMGGGVFYVHLASYSGGGDLGGAFNAYSGLADIYQQLGRPEAVAAIAAKIRGLASNDQWALAQFYGQHGQPEEAAAIYKKLAEQSADPQTQANTWQALANVDARQEHYRDAIGATRQAIAAVESSSSPGVSSQALWMKQTLAGYMQRAGLLDQADQVYQQILRQSRGEPQEIQMLGAYAQYLAGTGRGAQGEGLLKDYLASSSNLDPQQEMTVWFNLSNVARLAGNSKSADEYRKAGQALQPPPLPTGQIRIADQVQKAQTALNEQRLDDAYGLALDALDAAAQAADGQQVQYLVPQLADRLAANKEPAKAERLFERLLALAQDWSVETMQPLVWATQSYARFLMCQQGRLSEAHAAIEQYRKVLTDANGPDSASLAEPLRLELEFERFHSQWQNADAAARDLLELQESLSGNTSEPYLNDLQNAARMYDAAGDSARALTMFRRAITLADLHAAPVNDWRRAQTRMEAALALARAGQFDEAETLGEEAVTLEGTATALGPQLVSQLEQIRRMKQAALAASARIDQ
jgi:hypothetical protein